ncbi:MAG: peptidylprolyl isomerase [Bdellovibrionales bacterium]|nr:peptidylprolyl isomerase [Bdellovibrionales bacterium]
MIFLARFFNIKTWFVILSCFICFDLYAAPPFKLPKQSDLNKLKSAVIETTKGKLYLELYPEDAPWHVANFKFLADHNYYNGLKFHIFERDYIIQGGGPKKNPFGDLNWSLPAEFNQRAHEYGTLGMAKKQDLINPDRSSSSTQFHILLNRAPHMDLSYTIFGKVVAGYDALAALRSNDEINKIIVYVRKSKN